MSPAVYPAGSDIICRIVKLPLNFIKRLKRTTRAHHVSTVFSYIVLFAVLIGIVTFLFPALLSLEIQYERSQPAAFDQFPVTVDPQNKTITEMAYVNAFFEDTTSPFQAAVGNTGHTFGELFQWVALSIADMPWYQSIAAADGRFVAITPGMRKEQAAHAFAKALRWSAEQKKEFLTAAAGSPLPLVEGSFSPGVYTVTMGTTPAAAQTLVNDRFNEDILSHYGPEIDRVVPLEQALTIASLIEREAGGADDMRLISGIIWNRLFINMNLQIDATLQYVKANSTATGNWWPNAAPADRFRKSPYNTYLHPGLPPTPIANPSVASVLAALNPRETSCLFYFHDAAKRFHCSDTYAGHVALLKQYYGRGK